MRTYSIRIFAPFALAFALVGFKANAQVADKTPAAAAPVGSISSVEVTHSGQLTIVHISGTGALHFQTSRLDSPSRLVLDFSETRLNAKRRKVPSEYAPVLDVRLGQSGPAQSRVVIDLDKLAPFEMQSDNSGVNVSFTTPASDFAPAAARPSQIPRAQDQHGEIFHVRHVEENAIYIDAGRNSGLQEGMKLSLFHANSPASSSGARPSTAATPVAELKVLIVADSSAVCQILTSTGEVRIGDIGFIAATIKPQRPQSEALVHGEDHSDSLGFVESDAPPDETGRAHVGVPTSMGQRHTAIRLGFDVDQTKVTGGFRETELGFQVSADMTHIAGTNWSFTGQWRNRFRETYSGLNGAQLESLSDRIARTYHIGLYYESPTSPIIAGFGRLSVPGAPSLPTIDGGYFGRKINHHVTLGIFGGSTPDPTAWDYNPNQRIAGLFTNIESGDFDGLHFSGAEGVAMTAIYWRSARRFAFFENTVSWKRYLWFYNSTQVDEARTSPLPGGGSNGNGVSFTSSSIRLQPTERLSVGLNHSYLNSLPTFDPNLLGTTLLDKYIFQGLSVDARYELFRHISVFSQIGRAKSIADAKRMWNSMYGVSLRDIGRSGFNADFQYAKFASSFGQGNYRALSISRSLNGGFEVELVAGSQSLVSSSTTNTSSHFVTTSTIWNLGPRFFLGTGYTWSNGTTMNYRQWNMMFGYRFGDFQPR